MRAMTLEEIKDKGILELVNRSVLHPKGMALGIEGRKQDDGNIEYLSLHVYDYGEPVKYEGE